MAVCLCIMLVFLRIGNIYSKNNNNVIHFNQTLFFLFTRNWIHDHSDDDVQAGISLFYLGATCRPLWISSEKRTDGKWGHFGLYLSVHRWNDIRRYFEDGFSTIDPFHIRSILFRRRGIKERERKSPTSCSSITSLLLFLLFTPFCFSVLITLVLLASLIARYPGGRLHETGMLNSWDDRRPSLSRGSHE